MPSGSPPRIDIGNAPSRPYRGAASYGASDRAFFFGRDDAADSIVSLILGRNLSLLHALSGMGKTSLLEALAMPILEDLGWITLRCRPHLDPVLTLKRTILDRVLPDPQDECRAISGIQRVIEARGQSREMALAAATQWFRESVSRSDPDFMALQTYRRPEGPETADHAVVVPFSTRLFQYSSGLRILERQITAFDGLAGPGIWSDGSLRGRRDELADASFDRLHAFFSDERVRRMHAGLRRSLEAPELPLTTFLERLHGIWGKRYDSFGLVIVLDQFEEIFTRYVDMPGGLGTRPHDAPDWELRPAFFRELGTLVKAVERNPELPPLRILISMRDDFIANLDQLTSQTGEIPGAARYHLDALSLGAARQAIVKPAVLFGVGYEPDLLAAIVDNLAKESAWIEPGHLQIVCEYMWEHAGAALANQGGGTIPLQAMPTATGTTGVQVIITDYFEKILGFDDEGAPRTDAQKVEMLDLLEPLMTQRGTRNIVEIERLRLAPFRNIALRTSLLDVLNRQRIVRTEPRLGGLFVEITHEFLIQPVFKAMQDLFRDGGNADHVDTADKRYLWGRLPLAFQRLGEIQYSFRRTGARQLDQEELAALDAFSELVDLEGHPWIAEAMFRSALVSGLEPHELSRHMERLHAKPPTVQFETLRASLGDRIRENVTLDHLELRALVEGSDWLGGYSAEQRRFLLDSAMANLSVDQRDLIVTITEGVRT